MWAQSIAPLCTNLAVDASGDIYITDSENYGIRRVEAGSDDFKVLRECRRSLQRL